jgi:hypothetical protein
MAARSSANVLTWNSWAPSFWSAYSAARAWLNASIASMRFCKTWTRQVRRRTSAEITFAAIASISSFMRVETMTFKRKRGIWVAPDARRQPFRGSTFRR